MDRPPSRHNRSTLTNGGAQSARPPGRGRRRHNRSTAPTSSNSNTTSTSSTRPRSSRSKNRHRRRPIHHPPSQPPIVLKVIVRKLPPTLSAQDFQKQANPRGADRAVWRAYSPGSSANIGTLKRTTHVIRHSVAYLGFTDIQHAIHFHNQFTGFKFVETNNTSSTSATNSVAAIVNNNITSNTRTRPANEYTAKVERAIWQTTPPPTRKKNPLANLQGTIESDPDYLAFCEKLQAEARGEDVKKTSTAPSQNSDLFNTSRYQSIPNIPEPSGLVVADEKSKPKMPAMSPVNNGKANVVTPLMEDVRAKRKERDQKKKAPKTTPRAMRAKGRQPVIIDSQKMSDSSTKNSAKNSTRKKKKRANEIPNGDKRNEDVVVHENRSQTPKPPPLDRRDGSIFRDELSMLPENHITSVSLNSSPYVSTSMSGPNPNEIQVPPRSNGRNNSNRSRYGRSPRARGRFSPNRNPVSSPRNDFPPSRSGNHNTVRLLKKEASATSKT